MHFPLRIRVATCRRKGKPAGLWEFRGAPWGLRDKATAPGTHPLGRLLRRFSTWESGDFSTSGSLSNKAQQTHQSKHLQPFYVQV